MPLLRGHGPPRRVDHGRAVWRKHGFNCGGAKLLAVSEKAHDEGIEHGRKMGIVLFI